MVQSPPAAPPPPATATPKVAIGGATPVEIPRTAAEIQRLRAKGRELSTQLESATERREEVISELKDANVDARPGLEARLKVLDQRIVSLEQEIEANSRAIANAPLELVQRAESQPAARRSGPDPDVVVPVVAIIGCFGLLPLAIGYTVRMLRRPQIPAPSPRDTQQDERLARMEQAIDTMSIELERITEGQRFVTKLMTEQAARGLGAGAAQPVPVAARDAAREEAR